MAGLTPFPKFDIYGEENSLGVRWDKYVAKLENLFVGLGIESKKRRKALLLHYAGDEVFEVYDTLNLEGDDSNYDAVKENLSKYFNPKKNKEFERYEFRNIHQEPNETIDQFVTKLRKKAANCEFHDKDGEIKSQLIQGCHSKKLRIRFLESEKSLDDMLTMARTMEIAERQASSMEDAQVNKVRNKSHSHAKRELNQRESQPKRTCRNCGGEYPHDKKCPALGARCNYCHKLNHFLAVCRKRNNVQPEKQLREISQECAGFEENAGSDSESAVSFGISHLNKISENKVPRVVLKVNGVIKRFLVDTGSSLNIIDESMVRNMKPVPRLQKTNTKAYAFGQSKPLIIKGKYSCEVESHSKITTTEFHVVQGSSENLISYETAVELGIVPVIKSVTSGDKYTILCDKYKPVFTGLGKLKDRQIKFHVDESIVPVAQQPRRIPFHIREQVAKELSKLEEMDVIEKVKGPTPWVSNLVIAPKPKSPNEIRLCVDMRKANLALKRERYVTPTIDDIILELNGSSVFSKVDLNKGFHQIELSEESRNITAFNGLDSLWRYKRLNMGDAVAPEIFQREIKQVLNGLNGVLNVSDDIIIHGKTQANHDANLEAILKRLQERNLTLNKRKCEFNKRKITFYGYVFSSSGISPDPEKIKAIKNVEQPKNEGEVRSFLGMTNYVSRFINNYSTISEPLRRLTQQKTPFVWGSQQESAFTELKNALVSDQVMTYFDPTKPTELWVDASPVGVSGILIQESKIVSYGSRSLTPVEQRYSQTEREALACVWGCQHFHLYLFGKEFVLISDHRSLESIFNNTKQIQSARLERWRLRLTTYNFKVKYRSGSQMISDYCSRHPVNGTLTDNVAEDYVRFIANATVPKSLTLTDISRATQKDCVMTCVMSALQTNMWTKQTCSQSDSYKCYQNVSDELTVVSLEDGDILLRGTRLCIPKSLQHQVVDLAHQGHQGRVRCKSLLRETCWFPYMDKQVDEKCRSCIPCMSASPTMTPEPIKPSPLPKQPWDEVSVDFCGPFPTGEYFMVVICDYSRYPVVDTLNSLSAKTVIPRLEKIFGLFSIPSVVKSDNGSPFNSHEFAEFASRFGFKHRKITPLHPMANGTCEAFMKPLVKALKTATASNQNYKSELSSFLMNYRSTPHPSTGVSPFEAMFNRKMKTKLPQFSVPRKDTIIRNRDTNSKLKNKRYADNRRHCKPSTLKPGDSVLVKQRMNNKLCTPFSHTLGKVLRRNGSMVTVRYKDHDVTRDVSHFKLVPSTSDRQEARGQLQTQPGITEKQRTPTLRRSNRECRKPKRYED